MKKEVVLALAGTNADDDNLTLVMPVKLLARSYEM